MPRFPDSVPGSPIRWRRLSSGRKRVLPGAVLLPLVACAGCATTLSSIAATASGRAGGVGPQIVAVVGASPGAPQPLELPAADRARLQNNFGKLPLTFIENQGQADERIAYYTHSPGHSLTFTRDGHALRLSRANDEGTQAHTIKVELVEGAPERIESLQRAPGIVSYFKGPKEQWKTAIPTHSKIGYVRPWPGIDLSYDGTNGRLESVYTVAPHADPSQIKLRYSGQDSLTLDDDGNLVYSTSIGEIQETAPIAWQDIDGQRVSVGTRFTLLDDSTVAFQVAKYDPSHALIIDPTLIYAGFIGGSADDRGRAIAVDSAGNAYVTGYTGSTEATFPATVGPDLTYNGSGITDAFVAKVNPAGTALVYAGYIGGSGNDVGNGIAVDSAGNAYVTGLTTSTEATFPATVGPDLTSNDGDDAFVAKVNPGGTALVYAGYIGGSGTDGGNGIAVDSTGNAYVTGVTTSTEDTFPATVGPDLTFNGSGGGDAFVAKVNAGGSALVYAGYIGGNAGEQGRGIAVDSAGNAYLTGNTNSTEATFPATVGPDLTSSGSTDVFVAKVNAAGSALVYAGYIGGSGQEFGFSIAVDSAGNAHVTGDTSSTEATFPATVGPDLTYNGSMTDAFVAKVNPAGSALVYAGYLGGSGEDSGRGIAVDGAGNAYVTGGTGSTEATFPATVGPDLTFNGIGDVFVAKVNPAGSTLLYAGYIGGNGSDTGTCIAVDSAGNAYVSGFTDSASATFPATVGPDLTYNGGGDSFVVKLSAGLPPPNGDFYTLAPCRVVDTRGGAPIGGPILTHGSERTLALAGKCLIPSAARAVSLNITAIGPLGPGNLVLYPVAGAATNTTAISFNAGTTRANNAVFGLNDLGELQVLPFVANPAGPDQVHLVVDVNGYFD
jgi:Beta-propeller repeat